MDKICEYIPSLIFYTDEKKYLLLSTLVVPVFQISKKMKLLFYISMG